MLRARLLHTAEIAVMRKKFDLDKLRVAQMRTERKFRQVQLLIASLCGVGWSRCMSLISALTIPTPVDRSSSWHRPY